MDRKVLIWGGAGVVALLAGAWIYSSVGNSSSQSASNAIDPATLGALQPITYASGTGATPIDSGASAGGTSSLDALTALLPLQQQQEADSVALQNRSLDIQQMLGLRNIDANSAMNTANTNAAVTSSLATLAASLNQAVVSAKATAGVTGTINGNGLNLNYTAEQITGKSAWNTPLLNVQGGGITLANGTVVKG